MRATLLFISLLVSLSSTAQHNRKVVIIGIDGVRPDALATAHTPNLDALVSNGIYSPDALNDDVTVTGPGWSAVLCGVWSNKHTVFDNSFTPNNYHIYPSLIKRMEEFDSTRTSYSICSWAPLSDNIIQDDADEVVVVDNDALVAAEAPQYLLGNGPDLSLVYFDGPDFAGHDYGFAPNIPEYIQAIETVDEYVGQIVSSVTSRPTYEQENWMFVVTTDHGGVGTEHGSNSLEEENVFIIFSGDSIDPQLLLAQCENQHDPILNCIGYDSNLVFEQNGGRVSIPQSEALEFGSDQDFTVECRVRTNQNGDVAIVGTKDWSSGFTPGFVFSFTYPDGPEWKVNLADGTNRADVNTGGAIADGNWHTLTTTFDRDGLMTLFEDGVYTGDTDISSIGNINSDGLSIGADIMGYYPFSGSVAEVRIWNTVIEEPEIADWHCQPITSDHPNYGNLVGYWKLNEGSGTMCLDQSVNGNDGSVSEAYWSASDSTLVCNYDNTPRLVDVFPTVFDHLCIPVDPLWNLDGESLLSTECQQTSVGVTEDLQLSVHPNPTDGIIRLQLKDRAEDLQITLLNNLEILIHQDYFENQEILELNLPENSGLYFLKVTSGNGSRVVPVMRY